MTKQELINEILIMGDIENINFINEYGLPMGKGYDFIVSIKLFNSDDYHFIEAHAGRTSWALPELLRPNLMNTHYKGTNNYDYRTDIKDYWLHGNGYKNYLSRLNKKELSYLYATLEDMII